MAMKKKNPPGIPDSPFYRIDRRGYAAKREARMIELLDQFFWKCFFMLRMNRIPGDYLEFGSGSNVRSFRLAYKYRVLEYPEPRLFAFDSFQGLPEPTADDLHDQWRRGAMAVSLEDFHKVMRRMRAKPDDYTVVPGFYSETLDGTQPKTYGITRAAMVFVDCDLYSSAASTLRFVKPVLGDGTIIAFDDWYCYGGSPEKGEQRAFREFLKNNRRIQAAEYLDFGWHGKSFIIHKVKPKRRPARKRPARRNG